MTDVKHLKDDKLQKISSGDMINNSSNFDEVTKLLKAAGEMAYIKLGNNVCGVYYYIDKAEKTRSILERKDCIMKAIDMLEKSKDHLGEKDYFFIKEKLILSQKLTNE